MTNDQLSAQGQQRRNESLTLVLEQSRRVRHRRKRQGATALMLIVATVVWAFWSPVEPRPNRPLANRLRGGTPSSSVSFDLERHLVRTEVDDLGQYTWSKLVSRFLRASFWTTRNAAQNVDSVDLTFQRLRQETLG